MQNLKELKQELRNDIGEIGINNMDPIERLFSREAEDTLYMEWLSSTPQEAEDRMSIIHAILLKWREKIKAEWGPKKGEELIRILEDIIGRDEITKEQLEQYGIDDDFQFHYQNLLEHRYKSQVILEVVKLPTIEERLVFLKTNPFLRFVGEIFLTSLEKFVLEIEEQKIRDKAAEKYVKAFTTLRDAFSGVKDSDISIFKKQDISTIGNEIRDGIQYNVITEAFPVANNRPIGEVFDLIQREWLDTNEQFKGDERNLNKLIDLFNECVHHHNERVIGYNALNATDEILQVLSGNPKDRELTLWQIESMPPYADSIETIVKKYPNFNKNEKINDVITQVLEDFRSKDDINSPHYKDSEARKNIINDDKVLILSKDGKALLVNKDAYKTLEKEDYNRDATGLYLQVSDKDINKIEEKIGEAPILVPPGKLMLQPNLRIRKGFKGESLLIPAAVGVGTFGLALLISMVSVGTYIAWKEGISAWDPAEKFFNSIMANKDYQNYVIAAAVITISAALIAGVAAFCMEQFKNTEESRLP